MPNALFLQVFPDSNQQFGVSCQSFPGALQVHIPNILASFDFSSILFLEIYITLVAQCKYNINY